MDAAERNATRYGWRRKCIVIILLCSMGLGCTIILEAPGSLRDTIVKEMRITQDQFQMHYYMLFWPNVFSWLFGFIIDNYIDLGVATVLFLTLASVANTLYVIGAITKVYLVMAFGYLFLGLGVEASYICINCYVLRWFPSRWTNAVFALTKSLPLLGSTLVICVSQQLLSRLSVYYVRGGHAFTMTVAIEMCVIVVPLVCAVMLACIFKPQAQENNSEDNNDSSSRNKSSFKLGDVAFIPPSFWILSVTVNLFFSSCFMFLKLNVLISKYGLDVKRSETLVNSFRVGACLMGPVLGLITDWKGKNLTFITLSFICGLIGHFTFAFTITDPFYPMVFLSVAYSLLIGSYWPLIKLIVKEEMISTALGLDHSILMVCFAVGNTVAPKLVKSSKNGIEIYYLTCTVLAIAGSFVLWALDCNFNKLNNTKIDQTHPVSANRQVIVNRKKRITRGDITARKFINATNRPIKSKPKSNDSLYFRLKKLEVEGNLYKHQRLRRNSHRMMDRRKSRSSEELFRLTSV